MLSAVSLSPHTRQQDYQGYKRVQVEDHGDDDDDEYDNDGMLKFRDDVETGIAPVPLFALCWMWFAVSAGCFADVLALATGQHAWSTAINELELSVWNSNLVACSFYIGWLVGDMMFGCIANYIGRLPALVAGALFAVVCGLCSTWSTSWQTLAVSRFGSGLFLGGVDLVAYVLMCELCANSSQRSRAGCVMQVAFAVGIASVGLVGLWAPDWRVGYFCTAALPCIVWLPLAGKLPESPEWLLEMQKGDQLQEASLTYRILRAPQLSPVYPGSE